MSTQPGRVSSDTLESGLHIGPRRERLKFPVHHSGPILVAGGFAILVLLIFITGLGVVSRATLLFSEVSTINTEFRQLSLDLERLRSDVFLAGSYARDQLFDADSDSIEDRRNQFLKARSTVETRLIAVSPHVAPEQQTEFDQLRMEIESYWKLAEAVFNQVDGETRSVRLLQRELTLRRNSVLTIVATIGSINESAVEQRQHEIETAQNDLIQYTRRMILVSSLLGLIVAIAAGCGDDLLPKPAGPQTRPAEHARQELRNHSSPLVPAQGE